MSTLIIEQILNGLQYGLMLFLLAAGLTLIFGIMDVINLAHGSLYMLGAFFMASIYQVVPHFFLALILAIIVTALLGAVLEKLLFRHLQKMSHMTQVLATFALILMANESVKMVFGPQPLFLSVPDSLSGSVSLLGGELQYPIYRLLIIVIGLAVAMGLYGLINQTRLGMHLRAGTTNPSMTAVMGIRIQPLFTLVFALGAGLCALAGSLLGPLMSVSIGMGESILIIAFQVIVIGGIGSVRGALIGSIIVGMIDTLGRLIITVLLKSAGIAAASSVGATMAAMLISLLMITVLFFKPQGLFPGRG